MNKPYNVDDILNEIKAKKARSARPARPAPARPAENPAPARPAENPSPARPETSTATAPRPAEPAPQPEAQQQQPPRQPRPSEQQQPRPQQQPKQQQRPDLFIQIQGKPGNVTAGNCQVNVAPLPVVTSGTGAKQNHFLNIILFRQLNDLFFHPFWYILHEIPPGTLTFRRFLPLPDTAKFQKRSAWTGFPAVPAERVLPVRSCNNTVSSGTGSGYPPGCPA